MLITFGLNQIKLLLFYAILWTVQGYKSYKDYKVYSLTTANELQQATLYELSKNGAYDFLTLQRKVNTTAQVLVGPESATAFEASLRAHNIAFELLTDDVSIHLSEQLTANQLQREQQQRRRQSAADLDVFAAFYRHYEINDYMEALAAAHPTRLYVKTFGRSYEGRPLKLLTITNGDGNLNKKVILIDAAMHSREWLATSTALYVIQQLVHNYTDNAELLEHFNWVIMPVVNADGYEYSHLEDRYWRKTRRPNAGTDCIGTDLNRNFGHYWGLEEGSSDDPCHDLYHGEHAFSEHESKMVRDIMLHYGKRLTYYLTLHSYGNMILLPWGYTSSIPDNFFEMMEVADEGAMAIARATGTSYSYGNSYHVIYPTSGDSTDYAVGVLNITVAMCMELPAGGPWGFDPPIRQIEEFILESWIGIRAMAEFVVRKY